MADFEEVLTKDNYGKGVWRASKGGDWVYLTDCWRGDDGIVRVNKSKKGNPYILRVHVESLDAFADFVAELRDKAEGEPF